MGFKPVEGPTYTREEYEQLKGAPQGASTGSFKPVQGPSYTPEEFEVYNKTLSSVRDNPSSDDLMRMQTEGWTPEQIANRSVETWRTENPRQTVTDLEKQQNMYSWPAQVGTGVVKGLANAGRNAIEVGTAVADVASTGFTYGTSKIANELGISDVKPINDYNPGLTEKFNRAVPELPYDTFTENIAGTLTENAVGMKGGDKLVKAVSKSPVTIGGKVSEYGKRFLGQEAGATIAQSDDDTAFLGNLVGVNPDDPEGMKVLKQKANVLNESLLIGLGIGAVAKPVVESSKYFYNMVPRAAKDWHNLDAHKKQFVSDLLGISGKSPEELVDFIKQHKEQVIELNDTLVKDSVVKRDTISAILKGLDPNDPNNAIAIELFEGLRSSTLKGGSGNLTQKLNAPYNELKKKTEEVFNTRGGEKGMDEALPEIQGMADAQVKPSQDAITVGKENVAKAERGIESELSNNPVLKDLRDTTTGSDVNIDFDAAKDTASEAMQSKISKVSKEITIEKNRLYDAISPTAPVNAQMVDDAVAQLEIELPDLIKERLELGKSSYKNLRTFAKTDLEKLRQTLRKENEWGQADQIAWLQNRLVDDQVEWLATASRNPDGKFKALRPDVAEAAQKADDYMKKMVVPLLRDNKPMREMQQNTWYQSGSTDATVANRKILEGVIGDRQSREYTTKIATALGDDKKLMRDYVYANAAKELRTELNASGKLSSEAVTRLSTKFNEFIPALKASDPNAVDGLNKLLTTMRDANFNKKELVDQLDALEEAGRKAEHKAYGEEFNQFFSKSVDGYKRNTNSFDSMVKLLREGESKETIAKILKSDNEVAKKGLQAAYAQAAKDNYLKGDFPPSLERNFLENGKQVFEGTTIPQALESLANTAREAAGANKTRMIKGFDLKGPQNNMQIAVNTVTTWVFGVLNPTAARIRTVSGDFMKKHDSWGKAKLAADIILANPDEFVKIAESMAKKDANKIDPATKTMLFRMFTRAGYNIEDPEKQNQQTNKVIAR
jgi:hypothetical protein